MKKRLAKLLFDTDWGPLIVRGGTVLASGNGASQQPGEGE